MIAFLNGTLADKSPTQVTIEVSGVGYELQISLHTYESLKEATTCKIFTYLHITQDVHTLYGFENIEEKHWFLQLLSVNGIGPRLAITILSSLAPDKLQQAIRNQHASTLQAIKGIGQKVAQRIILELKDKVAKVEGVPLSMRSPNQHIIYEEALAALAKLGIAKSTTEKVFAIALKNYEGEVTVEALIRLVLKG